MTIVTTLIDLEVNLIENNLIHITELVMGNSRVVIIVTLVNKGEQW